MLMFFSCFSAGPIRNKTCFRVHIVNNIMIIDFVNTVITFNFIYFSVSEIRSGLWTLEILRIVITN